MNLLCQMEHLGQILETIANGAVQWTVELKLLVLVELIASMDNLEEVAERCVSKTMRICGNPCIIW